MRETVSLPFQYLCVLILITSVLTKTPTLQCVLKDLGGECSFGTVCIHREGTSSCQTRLRPFNGVSLIFHEEESDCS